MKMSLANRCQWVQKVARLQQGNLSIVQSHFPEKILYPRLVRRGFFLVVHSLKYIKRFTYGFNPYLSNLLEVIKFTSNY